MQNDNEEEQELADQIASCLTVVLRSYGDRAMPLIEPLMPHLGALLDSSRPPEERRIGLCLLDDIIEHSPAGVAVQLGSGQACRLPGHPHTMCMDLGSGAIWLSTVCSTWSCRFGSLAGLLPGSRLHACFYMHLRTGIRWGFVLPAQRRSKASRSVLSIAQAIPK